METRTILAVVLSILVFLIFTFLGQHYTPTPPAEVPQTAEQAQPAEQAADEGQRGLRQEEHADPQAEQQAAADGPGAPVVAFAHVVHVGPSGPEGVHLCTGRARSA